MVERRTALVLILFLSLGLGTAHAADALVVDHECTDIWQIPESAISKAKSDLHIAYGHTSHGSQLIAGMGSSGGAELDAFMSANGATAGLYRWNAGGTGGALDLRDRAFSGASDLGNPNRTAWASATRTWLAAHPETNVIIWSWCGQADTTIANIDIYLDLMEGLIDDFPGVHFVFMTGHLTGSGASGQLHLANEHIRDHCRTHGRILYDFADIESFGPDGTVDYMRLMANDNCDYDSDGNGTRDRNWALDWQNSHTEDVDWWASGAAHSQHLNGNRKGYAAWWLWARLAGWGTAACLAAPSGLVATADPVAGRIELTWTDNSAAPDEESFVVQRRRVGGSWKNSFAVVGSGVTTYVDAGLSPGTYEYRIVARSSGACDSTPSNVASAVIPTPPEPGPAPKLRRFVVTGGKKQTSLTVRLDAFVNGEATGCRVWEIRDGNEPPAFTPGAPVDGVYSGLEVTLSADPTLPGSRRIAVEVERDGGRSNVKTRRVKLVAPKVKKIVVADGRKRTDPSLLLAALVRRDAVGYRVWEALPGQVAPAFTMGAPVDGLYDALPLTLSTEAGLPRRRVVYVQVTGEAVKSKVKKLVIQLR